MSGTSGNFNVVPFAPSTKKPHEYETQEVFEELLIDYTDLTVPTLTELFVGLAKELGFYKIAVNFETQINLNYEFVQNQIAMFDEESSDPHTSIEEKLELLLLLDVLSQKIKLRDAVSKISALVSESSRDCLYGSQFPTGLKVEFHNMVRENQRK